MNKLMNYYRARFYQHKTPKRFLIHGPDDPALGVFAYSFVTYISTSWWILDARAWRTVESLITAFEEMASSDVETIVIQHLEELGELAEEFLPRWDGFKTKNLVIITTDPKNIVKGLLVPQRIDETLILPPLSEEECSQILCDYLRLPGISVDLHEAQAIYMKSRSFIEHAIGDQNFATSSKESLLKLLYAAPKNYMSYLETAREAFAKELWHQVNDQVTKIAPRLGVLSSVKSPEPVKVPFDRIAQYDMTDAEMSVNVLWSLTFIDPGLAVKEMEKFVAAHSVHVREVNKMLSLRIFAELFRLFATDPYRPRPIAIIRGLEEELFLCDFDFLMQIAGPLLSSLYSVKMKKRGQFLFRKLVEQKHIYEVLRWNHLRNPLTVESFLSVIEQAKSEPETFGHVLEQIILKTRNKIFYWEFLRAYFEMKVSDPYWKIFSTVFVTVEYELKDESRDFGGKNLLTKNLLISIEKRAISRMRLDPAKLKSKAQEWIADSGEFRDYFESIINFCG